MKEFQTFIDIEYLSNSQKILTQFQCFSSGLKADREVLLSYYHYYIKKTFRHCCKCNQTCNQYTDACVKFANMLQICIMNHVHYPLCCGAAGVVSVCR